MKNGQLSVEKIVKCGVLAAIACVLTMFPQVPTGTGGYVHFGDSVICLAAALMGPVCGAAVGALGHSMADLFSGYAVFVPATFIIKGVLGFVLGKILYGNITKKRLIIGSAAYLLIATLGYFIAEIPLYGVQTAAVALISTPIQCVMGSVVSYIVIPIAVKFKGRLGFK
ncbi:MAG TPA: ECF transporter S component [Candidatus Monoglobus merdigallinarum]|uniref:ECF transporter S component n=1 Tax=Candidatus Monoglobus merdigallinarum TaxID=2838698 RepID=A0A9D1PQ94_9FIRM|nr:ECF transporter S component [Candidatus Monoglobus merdigallinarum]